MEKIYLKQQQQQQQQQQQKIANMTKTETTDTINNNTNYTRAENHTNIQFTHEKIQILNKGLKYNLHHKNKNGSKHWPSKQGQQ
jgi:hypothetical protein